MQRFFYFLIFMFFFNINAYGIVSIINGEQQNIGGASAFLDLTDVPSTYTGEAGKALIVNVGESGLEFGSSISTHNDLTGRQGGVTTESYHLTETQHTDLTAGFTGTGDIVRAIAPTITDGLTVQGASSFDSTLTTGGKLTVSANGSDIYDLLTMYNDGVDATPDDYIRLSNRAYPTWYHNISGTISITPSHSNITFNVCNGTAGSTTDVLRLQGDGNTTLAGALTTGGDIETASDKAFFLGDKDTDGTWKIVRSGNNLEFQRRVSGSYVTISSLIP